MKNSDFIAQAAKIGESKIKLKKRLLEAKAVLSNDFRPMFKQYTFDFDAKRLYSKDLTYFLEWKNDGETTVGSVGLFQAGY